MELTVDERSLRFFFFEFRVKVKLRNKFDLFIQKFLPEFWKVVEWEHIWFNKIGVDMLKLVMILELNLALHLCF